MSREKTGMLKKPGVIGWSFLLAGLLLLIGLVFRMNLVRYFVPKAAPETEEYLVSFRVANVRATSADFFAPGTVFYLSESGEVFGTLTGSVSETPAEMYMEYEDGTLGLVYDTDSGDNRRYDLSGTFLVEAADIEDKDLLALNGNVYLAPNREFTVYSSQFEVTLTVTNVVRK